uniref:dynamin-related protein 4C-like n=1 Tax=Erigeron canadensis TaxID=72917 RepID=UPI001CB9CCFC|nr:dynamin-related protein 4C-like [Erigeron canadensis]
MTTILKHFRARLLDVRYEDVEFLDYEYQLVSSQNSLSFENIASSELILAILEKQISAARNTIHNCVKEIFEYVQLILEKVFIDLAQDYYQLHLLLKQIARDIVEWTKKGFMKKVEELLKLEQKVVNTLEDRYTVILEECMSVKITDSELEAGAKSIKEFGSVKVGHLKHYPKHEVDLALKLKLSFALYWVHVVERFDGSFSMNLLSSLKDMIKVGIEETLTSYHSKLYEDNEPKLLEVEPVVHINMEKLETRTVCLNEIIKEIAMIQEEYAFLI